MTENNITDKNFDKEVLQNSGVTVVDFWAPWCGPCKVVEPVIDEIAEEHADKIKVGKLNVDDNPITTAKFKIMSIPTLILFKHGKEYEKMVGAHSKEEIEALIKKALHE